MNLKNEKSGYTLLEILVSFAIFGILLGIIVFGMRDTRNIEEFRTSITAFASTIKEVQNWALTGREAGNNVPPGGYGIHFDLSKASKAEDLDEGDNQYIVFADFVSVDSDVPECVSGVGNQRFDSRNFKPLVLECLGNYKDIKISPEGSLFGKNIKMTKLKINYSDINIVTILPSPSSEEILDIAFQNFKPFPYVGICSDNVCRDPENGDYDSKKINFLELYFMEEKISMCRKITIFGASGMVQEESVECST